MRFLALAPVALAMASPAPALDPPTVRDVRPLPGGSGGQAVLIFTDALGASAQNVTPVIAATLKSASGITPVELHLVAPGAATVQPGGFLAVRYDFALPVGASGDLVLSLNARGGYAFTFERQGQDAVQTASAARLPAPAAGAEPRAVSPPVRPNNAFIGNLSTYNPIYAVLGSGTDTNAKLELSFKYQLLGHPGDGEWYSGFHFAYTQRMFWDTAADSAPFRDVNYQPEFLYFYTLPKNEAGDQLSVRGGFLHESNGRDGDASRGYNIVYVQPQLDVPIGSFTASIGLRVFKYVIGRDNNPDIARYRGHQALAFSIGQHDGFKLSTFSRINFGTGKGSVDADLSYPLTRIWHDLPLYLVAQGFTGYGEDLLDYDRKQTRLRVGIGIVR